MKTKDFNIQGKAAEIFRQYGNSEMGCYKIQLMVEDYAKLAVEEFRNQPSGEAENICSCSAESECGYRNQPTERKGVKSVDEYLEGIKPFDIEKDYMTYHINDVRKSLTAMQEDYEQKFRECFALLEKVFNEFSKVDTWYLASMTDEEHEQFEQFIKANKG